MNLNNHKGFTLIEVIFSITLLGILGTSIFLLQGSILRYVATTQNKVSTCVFMHNAWIAHRLQSLYDKKTFPEFLQDALSSTKVEKKPVLTTTDEKLTFGKLFQVTIFQNEEDHLYAIQEQSSYIWYDALFKENDGK